MSRNYKIGDEDKVELYREFIKGMLKLGYAPFYIGQQLADIVRAIEQLEKE